MLEVSVCGTLASAALHSAANENMFYSTFSLPAETEQQRAVSSERGILVVLLSNYKALAFFSR